MYMTSSANLIVGKLRYSKEMPLPVTDMPQMCQSRDIGRPAYHRFDALYLNGGAESKGGGHLDGEILPVSRGKLLWKAENERGSKFNNITTRPHYGFKGTCKYH